MLILKNKVYEVPVLHLVTLLVFVAVQVGCAGSSLEMKERSTGDVADAVIPLIYSNGAWHVFDRVIVSQGNDTGLLVWQPQPSHELSVIIPSEFAEVSGIVVDFESHLEYACLRFDRGKEAVIESYRGFEVQSISPLGSGECRCGGLGDSKVVTIATDSEATCLRWQACDEYRCIRIIVSGVRDRGVGLRRKPGEARFIVMSNLDLKSVPELVSVARRQEVPGSHATDFGGYGSPTSP
ncbi:MAG: hypothetical protein AAGD32_13585 [Planctomycetota bacterium]